MDSQNDVPKNQQAKMTPLLLVFALIVPFASIEIALILFLARSLKARI
jgi:hypothetical protein